MSDIRQFVHSFAWNVWNRSLDSEKHSANIPSNCLRPFESCFIFAYQLQFKLCYKMLIWLEQPGNREKLFICPSAVEYIKSAFKLINIYLLLLRPFVVNMWEKLHFASCLLFVEKWPQTFNCPELAQFFGILVDLNWWHSYSAWMDCFNLLGALF